MGMREILEAVASGDISVEAAEAELSGYATTEAGRFDAAREHRRGIPEGILAEGKQPAQTASLAVTAVDTTGRAVVTRASEETVTRIRTQIDAEFPDATVRSDETARTVIVHGSEFERPATDATVCVVAAGTADQPAAGEAAVIAREAGATVDRVSDVGVANLDRMLDQTERLRDADVVVVAAGREGALSTVVAGLVSTPVIGLPVSTGYGHGGDGEAALSGMLQSCTVLSTVNVDAGFVAGTQAGLIAKAVGAARSGR